MCTRKSYCYIHFYPTLHNAQAYNREAVIIPLMYFQCGNVDVEYVYLRPFSLAMLTEQDLGYINSWRTNFSC